MPLVNINICKPLTFACKISFLILTGLLHNYSFASSCFNSAGKCSCTVSVNNMNFGTVNPANLTPATAYTTGAVNCRVNQNATTYYIINYKVSFSAGNSGNELSRQLKQSSNKLLYNLYTTSVYAIIVGDGKNGTDIWETETPWYLGPGETSSDPFPLYGEIAVGQTGISLGTYTDTIILTLTYQ